MSMNLVGPVIRHEIPLVIEDLTQFSLEYRVRDHVSATNHFGYDGSSFGTDRYADVFHPPAHNQYRDPTHILYGDLYDLQIGLHHTEVLSHRHSIDYYENMLHRRNEQMAQV